MTETDLQVGGGYTYQWECAILLALNTFFEPVRYNPTLFDLIDSFLGKVDQIHLEGEDRESGIDLEDINLITENRRILIQVKTKQAEGERWTLSDPLLLKALHRFYESRFLADQPEDTRFVFLTNRPFNPDLVGVKAAIGKGDVTACAAAERLRQYLDRHARGTSGDAVDGDRFRAMLARTRFVEYLGVDEVKANIQAKLQALGRDDWEAAHAVLFEHFARRSTRVGGATVTRASMTDLLGPSTKPSAPAHTPAPYRVDTGGGAYIGGDVTLYGGDFVSRDKHVGQASVPAGPPARPTVPPEGKPLALVGAALEARRLLLVWADVPFPPEERAPTPRALLINRWQQGAQSLPPFSWPAHELPTFTLLSLDPSDRLQVAFEEAKVPVNVLCTQEDVVDPGQHNLIMLGGSLASRSGLLLAWADVRDVPNDRDKVHLLKEAQRVARGGVILMVGDDPTERFVQLWKELASVYMGDAKHSFALGPADARWPNEVTHLSADVDAVLTRLSRMEVPPPTPSALEAPRPPKGLEGIHEKLDRLLHGQYGLRQGQIAIHRQVDASQRETVAQVLAGLQEARLEDAEVREELRGTLDSVRRALLHLQMQQLPDLGADLKQTLEEVTEILRADVDLRTGLELTIPLIPLLLSYRTTLEAGAGLDLRQAWEDLIDWAGR